MLYIHEQKLHIQNSVNTDQIATCASANSESTLLCFAISGNSVLVYIIGIIIRVTLMYFKRWERTYFSFYISIFEQRLLINFSNNIDPNQTTLFHGSTLYDCVDQKNLIAGHI